jgi:hypothetical protein
MVESASQPNSSPHCDLFALLEQFTAAVDHRLLPELVAYVGR